MLHSSSLVGFLFINFSNDGEIRAKNRVSENKLAEGTRYFYRQMLTSLGMLYPLNWDRHVVSKCR